MSVRILEGDALTVLRTLPDQSVQCCVTSPPYFGLRDYGVVGQLGLEKTPQLYVDAMVGVFSEVKRVLRDDGVLFLNIGDSYATGGGERKYGSYDGATGRGPGARRFRGGVEREGVYDTSDITPEGSTDRDCLCGSLCGVCRAAYRIGRAHSGSPIEPTPAASQSGSSLERRESERGHLPTSDSCLQAGHTEGATEDRSQGQFPADGQPRVGPATNSDESFLQPQGDSHPSGSSSSCRLCGRSLADDARASADMRDCTCDTSPTFSSSDSRTRTGRSVDPYCNLKQKDLIGIPWMLAFALRADGWYLRSDIIWHKPNPMPESVTDRPTKSHEYLFLLSKSPTYYYDADAIAEPGADSSVARLSQNIAGQKGSHRVPGKTNGPMKAVAQHKQLAMGRNLNTSSLGSNDEPLWRNARSVWSITTIGYKEAHFATFPPKLIEPCILAGSAKQACEKCGAPWERITGREKQPEAYPDRKYDRSDPMFATKRNLGGRYQAELDANPKLTLGFKPTCDCENSGTGKSLVLDPFGGAGTTGLVADRLGRDAILIELNPKYAEMARKRIHSDNPLFTDVA